MCRSIRPLNNLAPPATDQEIYEAALQYVRKIAGARRPSQANQVAFDIAVRSVAAESRRLIDALVTKAPPRNREVEAAKRAARARQRGR